MYAQTLYKVITPVKQNTISRLNKSKKWKYGYDKEHDIVVISKVQRSWVVLRLVQLLHCAGKGEDSF